MEDRRQTTRYLPKSDTEVIFTYMFGKKQLTVQSLRVFDISRRGCTFQVKEIMLFKPGVVGELRLQRESVRDDIGSAKIERTWGDGMAVSFSSSARIERYIGKKPTQISEKLRESLEKFKETMLKDRDKMAEEGAKKFVLECQELLERVQNEKRKKGLMDRKDALNLLRGGPTGIQKWNSHRETSYTSIIVFLL